MPAYHVQRSIVISAKPDTVFDTLVDYGTWTKWSPWLTIDKEAIVTVSDDACSVNSVYAWEGEFVGQGEIQHQQLNRPTLIEDEIRFFKPFKSKSGVHFELEAVSDGTKVTWHMNGRLPWFMFWMRSSMETFIGMDYERGLRMLREFIETAGILSTTEVVGVESVEARSMVGARTSALTNDVGPAMRAAFEKVNAAVACEDSFADREMLSVYHPGDIRKGRFDFTAGYTLSTQSSAPAGLVNVEIPAGNYLHVRHTGRYENLGNAWSGAHQYARYKKMKLAKRDCFEIYVNSPDTTATEDLITDIYLPVR